MRHMHITLETSKNAIFMRRIKDVETLNKKHGLQNNFGSIQKLLIQQYRT